MATVSGDGVRHAFLAAGAAAARLLRTDAVAAQWHTPSALEAWTVGGLAGHLGRAVLTVPRYLDADRPAPGSEPVDAAGYVLAAIDDDDLDVDSDRYTAIRSRGDEEAAPGPAHVAATVEQALARLRPALGRGPGRLPESRLVAVLDGIPMTLDDYLSTRVVELVVHMDDLGVSVGQQPAVPAQSLAVATAVVVDVARRRRGDLVVLRTMARRERAPQGPLAF